MADRLNWQFAFPGGQILLHSPASAGKHQRELEWNQEVTGRCVTDIVQWQQRAEEQLQLFTRWFHHSYCPSRLSLSLFLSQQFWICQDSEMPLRCAAPCLLTTFHVELCVRLFTGIRDSALQSVILWCSDGILKFPCINFSSRTHWES